MTFVKAAIGGVLISIATSTNLLLKGRITGFSGILFSLVSFEFGSFDWKLPFITLFLITGALMAHYKTQLKITDSFENLNIMASDLTYLGFIIGGLLVGIGTKL